MTSRRLFVLAASACVVAVVVAIGLYWTQRHNTSLGLPTPGGLLDPALGPASATVTIIEYADFGCPTCRSWHRSSVLQQLRSFYGDKIRFVWRDFPVITSYSPEAAEAGRCAQDQGKFWQYHDYLYEKATGIDVASLKSYASLLGLDAKVFSACLTDGIHRTQVRRELEDALTLGFTGTPSFLINNKPIVGPPSFEYLRSLIDPIVASQ
jgi:protein-disulfide isomerase